MPRRAGIRLCGVVLGAVVLLAGVPTGAVAATPQPPFTSWTESLSSIESRR